MKYVIFSLLLLGLGLLAVSQVQAFTILSSSYRLSQPLTYECGKPELAQAVANWDTASDLIIDGGCSGNPKLKVVYIPNATWDALPSVVASYHNCHALGNGTIECRVSIQPQTSASSILTHEVGHELGLGHSVDPGAIMNAVPCVKPDRNTYINCNSINEDDLNGIQFLYGVKTPTPTVVSIFTNTPINTNTPSPSVTVQPTVIPTVTMPTVTPTVSSTPVKNPTVPNVPTIINIQTVPPQQTVTPIVKTMFKLYAPGIIVD